MRRSYEKHPTGGTCRKKYESITSDHDLAPNGTGFSFRITLQGVTCNRCVTIHHQVFLLFYCPALSPCPESKTPRLQHRNKYLTALEPGDQQIKQISSSVLQPYRSEHTPECPRARAKTFQNMTMTWPRFERGCPADGTSIWRKYSRCVILHHQVVFFLFSSHTLCLNYTHPASNNSTQRKCTVPHTTKSKIQELWKEHCLSCRPTVCKNTHLISRAQHKKRIL
jgi:hypothetical protein